VLAIVGVQPTGRRTSESAADLACPWGCWWPGGFYQKPAPAFEPCIEVLRQQRHCCQCCGSGARGAPSRASGTVASSRSMSADSTGSCVSVTASGSTHAGEVRGVRSQRKGPDDAKASVEWRVVSLTKLYVALHSSCFHHISTWYSYKLIQQQTSY
jgi:hypothetical protein